MISPENSNTPPPHRHRKKILVINFLFWASVLVCLISIAIIVDNVSGYFESKREKEKLLTEKVLAEKREREAKLLAFKKKEARKKYLRELSIEQRKIKLHAQGLAQSGQLFNAYQYLTNYQGKFAKDTQYFRSIMSKGYLSKYKTQIEAQKKEAIRSIARCLLKRDYNGAYRFLEKYPPPVPPDIKLPVEELRQVEVNTAATFKNDIGGLIMFSMKNGSTYSAKLTGVSGCFLQIIHAGKKKKIRVSDVADTEKDKRLSFLSQNSKALYLGLEAYNSNYPKKAETFFKKVNGKLKDEIILITGSRHNNEKEKQARIVFFKILRNASLIDDDIDNQYIKKQLTTREAGQSQDRALKRQLDDFASKFSETLFKNKQNMALKLINNYLSEKVDFLEYAQIKNITVSYHTLKLSENPPGAFWDIPPSKLKRLYAKLSIGKYNSINLVIEKGKKTKARIAVDDDVDFIDKPSLEITKWTPVILLIKYDKCKPRKYCVEFRYSEHSKKLLYRTCCMRTGKIQIGELIYDVSILDSDIDADYSKMDNTFVMLKGNNSNEKLLRSSSRQVLYSEGKSYKIKSIQPDGSHVEFEAH